MHCYSCYVILSTILFSFLSDWYSALESKPVSHRHNTLTSCLCYSPCSYGDLRSFIKLACSLRTIVTMWNHIP